MTGVCLLCNACGAEWPTKYRRYNITTLRIMARTDGWVNTRKKDLCPNCRPRKKNGKLFKVNKNRKINGSYN